MPVAGRFPARGVRAGWQAGPVRYSEFWALVDEVLGRAHGRVLAASLKLFVFASLAVRLAVPLDAGASWLQWVVFVGCVMGVAAAVGVVESVMARLRMPMVPHALTAAGVIVAFGFVLLVTVP